MGLQSHHSIKHRQSRVKGSRAHGKISVEKDEQWDEDVAAGTIKIMNKSGSERWEGTRAVSGGLLPQSSGDRLVWVEATFGSASSRSLFEGTTKVRFQSAARVDFVAEGEESGKVTDEWVVGWMDQWNA